MFQALTLPIAGGTLPAVRFPGLRPPTRHLTVSAFAAAPAAAEVRRAASLYEVLQLKETATPVEIKTAYRSLAKRFHPDAADSDGRDFIIISEAYATLSDAAARAQYDRSIGRRGWASIGASRFASAVRPRRWETDQCW